LNLSFNATKKNGIKPNVYRRTIALWTYTRIVHDIFHNQTFHFSQLIQQSGYIINSTFTPKAKLHDELRFTEGFSHFVTSMTAPVASGWSGCRVGLAPTGKAPPYHGAHP